MRFIYTKTFIFFSACLVVGVLLIFLNAKGYLSPLRAGVLAAPRPIAALGKAVARPIKGFFGAIYTLRDIARQNVQLEAKVGQLQQQVVLLDQYRLENEALKKELGFVNQSQGSLVPCSVLSSDPMGFAGSLVLSCGEKSGVKAGEAVVSQGHLVGKIVLVSGDSSAALLITNSQSAVDAKISKTGTEGVVRGSFASGLVLDLVSQSSEISAGDIIVTAGINAQIPKNILIGEAGDLLSGPNDLFKKRTVISPVNFQDLDFVFVVKQ